VTCRPLLRNGLANTCRDTILEDKPQQGGGNKRVHGYENERCRLLETGAVHAKVAHISMEVDS
jgi:hypothetical protein